jgi:hypothetical protein
MSTTSQYVSLNPEPMSGPSIGSPAGDENAVVTCQPLEIGWGPNGVSNGLTFLIVLYQLDSNSDYNVICELKFPWVALATLPAGTQSWAWPSVNVTQGHYSIVVTDDYPNCTALSFDVVNGTDTSCLDNGGLDFHPVIPTSPSPPTHHDSSGVIIGCVSGIVLAATGVLIFYVVRRRRRQAKQASLKSPPVYHLSERSGTEWPGTRRSASPGGMSTAAPSLAY